MKKPNAPGISPPQRSATAAGATLRYGLRELAPQPSARIFVGTLRMLEGQLVLEAADGRYQVDVHSPLHADPQLQDQRISVLGYLAEPDLDSYAGAASLTAMRLVSHEAVSLRAYEIHESHRDGGAVDNWLRAQWELLAR